MGWGAAPGERRGGRAKGTPNKRTVAVQEAAAEAAAKIEAALGPKAFEGDAHALLMAVYKDETNDLAMRVDAAAKAIAFEKPKLAQIDQRLEAEVRQRVSAETMSDEEWEAKYGGAKG